jgi:putative hemolysin
MSRKTLFIGLILLALLITWLQFTKSSQAGLANPASQYCIEQGGRLEIRKDADGNEYGVCLLPNGSECEEWALFRDKECIAP